MQLWQSILADMRGVSPEDESSLRASMDVDLAACRAGTESRMPLSRFDCTVVLPRLDVRFRIRADSDDLYHVIPYREGDVHQAILGSLRRDDVFIDAGANIGYYSILASRIVGNGGRVAAIEPHPGTAARLRENISLNGCTNVDVHEAALWNGKQELLRLMTVGASYGEARVNSGPLYERDGELAVTGQTLDEICRPFAHIALIKLDIEGAEVQALQGAEETLGKTETLVVECYWRADEIAAILCGHGFALTRLAFGHHILAQAPYNRPPPGSRDRNRQ